MKVKEYMISVYAVLVKNSKRDIELSLIHILSEDEPRELNVVVSAVGVEVITI